jgi:hypothetical protein
MDDAHERPEPSRERKAVGRVLGRVALWLLVLLAGVGVGRLWLDIREMNDRHRVFCGCHSDRICIVEYPLREYAEKHDGRLPSPSELGSFARPGGPPFRCLNGEKPFCINPNLGQFTLQDGEGRLIAWCPAGSHGSYVAAIVIENGEFRSKTLPIAELARLLERELTDRGVTPAG